MAITLKQRYTKEFNPKTGVFGTLYTKNQFSKDISGGGASGQPFIQRPIPSIDDEIIGQYYSLTTQALSLDFPIRGGSYEEIASREDFARIDRFFLYYPQGKAFTDKYRGLLRSNPKIESGREQNDSNTRVFPIGNQGLGSRNLIEQIASVGTGFHLPNAGSDILSLTEQEDLYGRIVAHKPTNANRLVSLYNLHILPRPTETFTKSREAQDSIRFLGIQPGRNAIELINYEGGPNSLYGLGSTVIRKATDNLGAIINTQDAPIFRGLPTTNFKGEEVQGRDLTTNLNYQKYQVASIVARDKGIITDDEIGIVTQGTDSSTIDNLEQQSGDTVRFTEKTGKKAVDRKFASTSNYDQLKKLGEPGSLTNAEDYVPSTKITDFRTEVDQPGTVYSRDYQDIKIDKATRIGLGNPGARPSNLRKKVSDVFIGGQDKVNLTEINTRGTGNIADFNSSVVGRDSEDAMVRDLIKFGFTIVGNSGGFTTLNFRAFLTGYSDSHNADWSSTRYAGRGENFYNYQGFDRQVNFNFKVAAQSKQEMGPLYRKLNYLVSSLYPDYSSQGFMQGNIVKLTIGDLFNQEPGILESINITVNDEYPWEIAMMEPEGKSDMKETPQILDCAVSFRPILKTLPALNKPILMSKLYDSGGAGRGATREVTPEITSGNNNNSNAFAGGL